MFRQFRLAPSERIPACCAMLVAIALNTLVIVKHTPLFTYYHKGDWGPFLSNFHVSGFDAIIYTMVSQGSTFYHISTRHPLLFFLLYPLHLLNSLLYTVTGFNFVQFLYGAILVCCAVWSFIFLVRIFQHVIGTSRREAHILGAYTFSFAYMMITICMPDHFALSLLILTFTLWMAGNAKRQQTPSSQESSTGRWGTGKTFWLVFITAGITLTNGIKTIMAAWYVNGKRFWRPKYIIPALLMPLLLNMLVSHYQYQLIGRPAEVAREKRKARIEKKEQRLHPEKTKKKKRPNALERKKGRALSKDGMLQWSDVTTPRLPIVIHNLFGESIQLHADSLLQDTGMKRPVIVKYRNPVPYVVEAIVLLLFVVGLWCGRKSRYLWLVMAWFAYDMVIHVVMGFALIEVFIMTAHWAFVIPIATAYLFTTLHGRKRTALCALITLLTLYLWTYNAYLFTTYLTA